MKILSNNHITAHERKLINFSIQNNLQPVQTPKKKLQILSNNNGIIEAALYSFEVGIGIGSTSRWVKRNIKFSI